MRQDRDYSRTFFVSKYGLTTGVLEAKGCIVPDSTNDLGEVIHEYGGKMLEVPRTDGYNSSTYYHKPDWHETLEEAKAHVVTMAKRKLAALDKQRVKLERLVAGDIGVTKLEGPPADEEQEDTPQVKRAATSPKKAAKGSEESMLQGWADNINAGK